MIKINLLESVTDRQTGAVSAVDKKVSNPVTRLILMSLAVMALLVLAVGVDVVSSQINKAKAEQELVVQKEKEKELEAVIKEQKELEQKIQNIDTRINAIKKLRASQAGPKAVLDALRERIGMTPGIYLESVEQKGDQLTIKGNSPDESAVTRFGGSLEFSGGLFSNLGIETQRKDMPNATPVVSTDPNVAPQVPQIVNFTIRCAYTPSKAGNSNSQMTAGNNLPAGQQPQANAPKPAPNQPAPAGQPSPPQVAKQQ